MLVEQCRAARALLGWSAQRLATEAEVGVATVRRYEGGAKVALSSVEVLARAMMRAGVVFIARDASSLTGGEGVRLTHPSETGTEE